MSKYLLVLLFFSSNVIFADVPAEQIREVEHLLNFVKHSNCMINRNGSIHPAEKGVAHIKRKYEYFRDNIKNTEDFIKFSATKSTMSGEFYTVNCPGKKTIKTRDWLLDELKRFRLKEDGDKY